MIKVATCDHWERHDHIEDCQDAPATLLCAFDGLLLTVPAACLTVLNERCLKHGQTFVCFIYIDMYMNMYIYTILCSLYVHIYIFCIVFWGVHFWGRVEEAGVSHKYQVETRLPTQRVNSGVVLQLLPPGFFLEAWNVWLHNPSIMLMFGLSIFAFIGNHLSVLYLLKATSATGFDFSRQEF